MDRIGVRNKKSLSTITSAVIIGAMTIAVAVIVIIIYNVVSSEIEYESESNLTLQIQKNSVVIGEDNQVSLKVFRGEGNSELEKIRFIFSDGTNIEEIERSAKDFQEKSEMDFNFIPKLVTEVKTIRIVPIIKVDGKNKYLSVQDSVQIQKQESGETIVETPTSICGNAQIESGEECDDGNLKNNDGCSSVCKKETVQNQTINLCGNGKIDSGEECDKGTDNGKICSASYGGSCTYCSSSCMNTVVQGGKCGDGTCNSPNEDFAICATDCPLCNPGETKQCGVTDVGECAYGTQTCGADKTWGVCTGEITSVAENTGAFCSDGKDNDCDTLVDCADTNCNGQTCGTGKVCSSGSCVATSYTLSVSKLGSGTVTSSPSGINCGSDCSELYSYGASVSLSQTASADYTFTGWGGACSGTGTCQVTMFSAKSVSATFVAAGPYSWYSGSWGTCSTSCGTGTQTRSVYCQAANGQQVADSYCSDAGAKPSSSQSCGNDGYSALGYCWFWGDGLVLFRDKTCVEICSYYGKSVASGNWNDNTNCDVCKHWYPGSPCEGTVCYTDGANNHIPPPLYRNNGVCYYRSSGEPCPTIRNSYGESQFCACA
ncbi:MAG: DUF4215 domain-containing protein [Nanoarchaeota archaeon]|nr:DUF4215 domain-containing protein [Nanoarchaeota archaeon]